jgi:outer membrane protein assembly factor BamA
VYQTSTVGRYLGQRSKVYATLMPSFSSRTRADLKPSEFTVPADVHLYNAIHEESFQELLFLIGWSTSLGEHLGYDPSHGMRFGVTTRTNALWPRDEDHGYFQLDTENRFYHPGFTKESRFAYRLATTMRLDTAGLYDGLYAGGLGGPRGWGESALGAGAAYVANNRVLTSVEYRFPLFTTPTISFDKLAQFHEGLREFYYRLDGAFFIDGAFLWHRLEEPMHGDSEWGLGVGAGLRVMAPTLRRAVSLDFGWSIGPGSRWREIKRLAEYEASRTRHYARHKADSRLEKVANRAWASYLAASPYLPVAHLYLDLPF